MESLGRYSILEEIASGAQGTVYRAYDSTTGGVVALKVLHSHVASDAGYLERFRREASLTASISHPNVIQIHEVGEADGRHFISMEFVPESLGHIIEVSASLPLETAARYVAEVADGLSAAHARGVTHRDIKPENVLLAPDGTAKVTDFGIARGEDLATITATGMMLGTPYYMSPEQAKGERADARSDIYSLGCLAYQLLTGRLPFRSTTPYAIIRAHVEDPPPPIRGVRADIPEPVAEVIHRALEKAPAARFQTMAEFAAAVRAAVPGIPAGAHPASTAVDATTSDVPERSAVEQETRLERDVEAELVARSDRAATPTAACARFGASTAP